MKIPRLVCMPAFVVIVGAFWHGHDGDASKKGWLDIGHYVCVNCLQ